MKLRQMKRKVLEKNLDITYVAPASVNAPVSVNVDNDRSDLTPITVHAFTITVAHLTVSVNVDSNGCIRNRYCQCLHWQEHMSIICAISTLIDNARYFIFAIE